MIELIIAFGAGLISFLSPCVLPLIPGYVSFITGSTLNEILEKKKIDLLPLIVFSLGFSFVFIIFGATASFLGTNSFTKFSNFKNYCRSYNNYILSSINWCFKY